MKTARHFSRLAVPCVLFVAAACATPAAEGRNPAQTSDECPTGSETVFSATIANDPDTGKFFNVYGVAEGPDSSLFVAYDPDSAEAGDETDEPSYRVGQLLDDGKISNLSDIVVDGGQIEASGLWVLASTRNDVYFYSQDTQQFVARSGADGSWSASRPMEEAIPLPPTVSVTSESEIFFATATQIYRLDLSGKSTLVAGGTAVAETNISYPEPAVSGIGGPALDASLNRITGLVVSQEGRVFFSSATQVFSISGDGSLEALVDLGAGEYDGSVAPYTSPNEQSVITGLAIGPQGNLLLADTGRQTINRIFDNGKVEVAYPDASGLVNGVVANAPGEPGVFVAYGSGERLCRFDR